MHDRLEKIKNSTEEFLKNATELKGIEELKVKVLGKKGELTEMLKSMGSLPKEERPAMGQLVNDVRIFIEEKFDYYTRNLSKKAREMQIKAEKIDVSIPGKKFEIGSKHPMTIVIDELKNIFIGMGYSIAEGPEVETNYYNFEALNVPENHPAKDEQDTFYTTCGHVLRTQTSPVQVRIMEKGELPIKIIAPGKVYRSDELDPTHSPVFHQLEGLVVDEGITMGDLKGALEVFAKELFGDETKVRFRPHYFPFTEPSAEMDATCFACKGSGCRVCKDSGWIELLGCGMVHPNVLEMSGIDSKKYSGFAFGMGLERVAMQRYGITDIRLLYENDIRFLKNF
ncbi:MAG: phenylalanine--tRNA ligase subunit alpha [Defluviitaleaceae bacterium]|nr:phenylalanine--tRNA ligase subunit alpha [Defluviitaleaceae bacterium]